jgi:ACS family pantothenate transporter-like MFS transporter
MLQVLGLLPNGILAVWPASIALKKFAFLTVNMHLVTAVLYIIPQYSTEQ